MSILSRVQSTTAALTSASATVAASTVIAVTVIAVTAELQALQALLQLSVCT